MENSFLALLWWRRLILIQQQNPFMVCYQKSSQMREESEQDDQPMENPYEQPSRHAGSSQQREEPVDQWEQQLSSPGSAEPQGDDEQDVEAPYDQEDAPPQGQDDPMGEEVVDLWTAEDDEDFVVNQAARSSISASNPWVLYEAGIICARYEDGRIKPNYYGEKVITLREWAFLLSPQRVALRRLSVGRADWEKLPWTGRMCYLFTRSWETGRLRSCYMKTGQYSRIDDVLMECRIDSARPGMVEAVFQFYQIHLDRLIRENDRLWGDFCRKKFDEHGNEVGLELNDATRPDVTVPMNKDIAIPDPEAHFSFSTKLMVLAIEPYLRDAPRDFCHYVNFAYKKLFQFVESRKEMTAQSHRFFVEHAYNQFFQHEAFNQSARARTRTKRSWRRWISCIYQA